MNKKVIVSASTVLASLLAYWYAKQAQKDAVPYMLVAGFIGSVLGETVAEQNDDKPHN